MKLARQGGRVESGSVELRASDYLIASLVGLLLVLAFFIGPLKLIGAGWLSYAAPDALAILTFIIVFSSRALRGLPLFAASPLTVPVLLLCGICFLQLANPEASFVRSVIGLRAWVLYLGFFFVGFYALRSTRQIRWLYVLLLALGCFTAAYGVYQWRAGPQAFANWSEQYRQYAGIMWSAGAFRAFSTFVLPNTFGANMGLLMLVAFGIAASRRILLRWRIAAAIAFTVMGAGIAVSGTRAPIVELVIAGVMGGAMLPARTARFRLWTMGAVLSIAAVLLAVNVTGPAINERFSSFADPGLYLWKWFTPLRYGVEIAASHPFGMGMGYTGGIPRFVENPALRELSTKIIDSGYGSAAAEMGFIGLLVFAYLVVKVGLEGVRAWERLRSGILRDLMLAPALFAILFPAIGLIGGTHATLPDSVYYWLLIGTLMRAPLLQKERDASQLSTSEVHT